MNWDDLRYFLALAREGAIRPAAKKLAVSHSTVARRIQIFEENLNVRLFDRTPDGFVMTTAGERILHSAEAIELQATELEREILGKDSKLEGNIRLAIAGPLAHYGLMDEIAAFAHKYPDINIEICESYEFVDLSRREADIAIRILNIGTQPPQHLVGRNLAVMNLCIYQPKKGLLDPENPHILGWGEGVRHPAWIKEMNIPQLPARHDIANAACNMEACAAGMGYSVLPCYFADQDNRIERIPDYPSWPRKNLWLLTHPDVRDTARFRLFREFLTNAILKEKHLLDGSLYETQTETIGDDHAA